MSKAIVTIDVFQAVQSDLADFAAERSGNVCETDQEFRSAAFSRATAKFARYNLRDVRRAVSDGLAELARR